MNKLKQMKLFLMTVLVALFVMLTSCSTDDGSGIIVAPGIEGEGVLENAVCYQGSWIVDDMVVDQAYVWDCDTALRMGHMPLIQFIRPLVPEGEQRAELASTIWHVDYTVPVERTGNSDDTYYYRIPQKNFRLFAEYGGEEHEIIVVTSATNSTMNKLRNGNSLTALLRLSEIWIDGVLQQVWNPELTLTFTSMERVSN